MKQGKEGEWRKEKSFKVSEKLNICERFEWTSLRWYFSTVFFCRFSRLYNIVAAASHFLYITNNVPPSPFSLHYTHYLKESLQGHPIFQA